MRRRLRGITATQTPAKRVRESRNGTKGGGRGGQGRGAQATSCIAHELLLHVIAERLAALFHHSRGAPHGAVVEVDERRVHGARVEVKDCVPISVRGKVPSCQLRGSG